MKSKSDLGRLARHDPSKLYLDRVEALPKRIIQILGKVGNLWIYRTHVLGDFKRARFFYKQSDSNG